MRVAMAFLISVGSVVTAMADTGPMIAIPGRPGVPVMINGQGPFDFVIDTGADRTVVSQELAKRLNLPESGTAVLHSLLKAPLQQIESVATTFRSMELSPTLLIRVPTVRGGSVLSTKDAKPLPPIVPS